MGFHEDLDEAVKIATREMLDWIVEMKGISRDDAYLLASVAMDLRVTQVVDGAKGIHAVIREVDLRPMSARVLRAVLFVASVALSAVPLAGQGRGAAAETR